MTPYHLIREQLILGDWVSQCTYAVYDGENMFLESYVEGETQV